MCQTHISADAVAAVACAGTAGVAGAGARAAPVAGDAESIADLVPSVALEAFGVASAETTVC